MSQLVLLIRKQLLAPVSQIQKAYAQVEDHYELMSENNVAVSAADIAEYRGVTIEFRYFIFK